MAVDWLASILPFVSDAKQSAILREHVSLLQSQRDDAIALLGKADAEAIRLDQTLANAKKEIARLEWEKQALEGKIRYLEDPKNVAPEAKRIALYLFEQDRSFSPEDIAQRLSFQIGMARHHFDALRNLGLISEFTGGIRSAGLPSSFELTPKGRAFAVSSRSS